MFQPYNLTPFDHYAPTGHFHFSLTFSLVDKNRIQAIQRMEDAVDRLVCRFPFLAGMVTPSTEPDGRSNVLRVRPATAAELEEYPILVTQNHPESIALVVDGKFNPVLAPFPIVYPPRHPSPVLRWKANVIGDKLQMVWCFQHQTMDGSGFFTLFSAFAAFCNDLNAPGPFTTAHAQEEIRQLINDIASTATPRDLNWTLFPVPTSEDEVPTDYSRMPINSSHVLDGQKIKILHDACNSALQSLPEEFRKDHPEISLPQSLVVSALLGICTSRARLRAFPDQKEPSSEMFIVENTRKTLNLPRRYIGNAILGSKSPCNGFVDPPPGVLQDIHVPESLSPVGPEDIWRLCNVAQTLQEASRTLDKQSIEGIIANMSQKSDWGSFLPGWGENFLVSDISSGSPYMNFGPLGDLQLFDMHFDSFSGCCWIMANLPSDIASPYPCWRLRWVLERAAMNCLSSDPLFQWATTPSTALSYVEV
ncbi:Fumigaclavine B O-acetyltransferase [Penicillium digitatum]|uniref:Uncharacterized protein n=3 Tax=Penicillium digitatum TaxID=36651 RepID=K9FWP1_PEND2|nr:hypothetical protein PDIP_84120 [Penicillium digitatum Pd1]EKV05238.1 hypothetical protein PDIP_84120 [Penicillium digitatum Pd1]EKV13564.1 hypothetical protein PDIG_37530 [Penicillium digitatum PHI26]QQK40209.1 Fumigaclavine B O-acetyltransferase [Penicillium digitatum]